MQPWQIYLDDANQRAVLRDQVAELCHQNVVVDRRLVAQLSKHYPQPVAELVLSSVEAQKRMVAKFGDGVWLGRTESAMQSTTAPVAKLKASWLGGIDAVDVCCGIGGDAIELAKRGRVSLVDNDPAMVIAAMTNAGVEEGHVADAADFIMDGPGKQRDQAVHIDPDRRQNQSRHTDADYYCPDWTQTIQIAKQFESAIIKIAPAADINDDPNHHRAWISLSGSVREQTVLVGGAIERARLSDGAKLSDGKRSAWRLMKSGSVHSFEASPDGPSPAWADQPSQWLIDPDRAVRAAGLTEAFAARFEMNPVGGPAGFLTATSDAVDRFFNDFGSIAVAAPVWWHGSVDDRKLRKVLRKNHWSVEVVKQRGGGGSGGGSVADPAVLQKRYQSAGDQPVMLWIASVGKRRYAAITSPANQSANQSPNQSANQSAKLSADPSSEVD